MTHMKIHRSSSTRGRLNHFLAHSLIRVQFLLTINTHRFELVKSVGETLLSHLRKMQELSKSSFLIISILLSFGLEAHAVNLVCYYNNNAYKYQSKKLL